MKYHVRIQYCFKRRKDGARRNGVDLGMEIEANDSDEALFKAEKSCLGHRWPSRIFVAALVEPRP
jgi:hypothetical protein